MKRKQPWQKTLEWFKETLTGIKFSEGTILFGHGKEIEKALKLCQKETIKRVFDEIGKEMIKYHPLSSISGFFICKEDYDKLKKRLLEET